MRRSLNWWFSSLNALGQRIFFVTFGEVQPFVFLLACVNIFGERDDGMLSSLPIPHQVPFENTQRIATFGA